MRIPAALPAAAVLAMLLTGCSETTADTRDADTKALKALETQWNQDFASKNAGKLAAYYADDAVLMTPGEPASSGKDAIRKALTEMVSDPALTLKFQASKVEVAKAGDLAYTQGSYTMTFTEPRSKQVINDRGSYVTTFRKQADGAWKAVADIATSQTPPAAPTAAPAVKKVRKAKKKR
jgi:uncharacterized protein (TIGR02246 family)